MAHSPAKKHYARVNAGVEAAKRKAFEPMDGSTPYELQMAQLHTDRLRLNQVQSAEGKAALKRELLPLYADYVLGVLENGQGAQDEVLTTVMVWAIDAGDYDGALSIAAYVLTHGLSLPDRFQRTVGCLVAEEIAEAALKDIGAGKAFDARVLEEVLQLTLGQDMPDEVRAKLYLAQGRSTLLSGTEENPVSAQVLEVCVANLNRAIQLHNSCGGKKDLERATRLLKKQAEGKPNG